MIEPAALDDHAGGRASAENQLCQNSASKITIGNGTPSSHSKAPRPNPIVASFGFKRRNNAG